MQLRGTRPGFAEQLAAVIEQPVTVPVRWSVLSPADAVQPMRRILSRFGLETAQAVRQGDGSLRPTWYEAPELWISRWINSETAVVLKEDEQGPVELRFIMRIATDTVRTVYRLGRGVAVTGLVGALHDLGIRRIEARVATADMSATELTRARGRGFTVTDRGDGWHDVVYQMPTTPPRPRGKERP